MKTLYIYNCFILLVITLIFLVLGLLYKFFYLEAFKNGKTLNAVVLNVKKEKKLKSGWRLHVTVDLNGENGAIDLPIDYNINEYLLVRVGTQLQSNKAILQEDYERMMILNSLIIYISTIIIISLIVVIRYQSKQIPPINYEYIK